MDRLSVPQIIARMIEQKRKLLAFGASGAVIGSIFTVLGTIAGAPVTAVVRPSPVSAYSTLAVPEIFNVSAESAFEGLMREMSRRSNLLEAIDAFQKSGDQPHIAAWLSARFINTNRITIEARRIDDNEKTDAGGRNIFVKLYGVHPRLAILLLERHMAIAHERTIKETLEARATSLSQERIRLQFALSAGEPQKRNPALLQQELEILRKEAVDRRLAQIQQLREALAVAEAAGITAPSLPDLMTSAVMASGNERTPASGFDVRGAPLFLYGTAALRQQIKLLEERVGDDHEDPRIMEVRRDLNAFQSPANGRVLRIRGDRDPVAENYAMMAQRLLVVEDLIRKPVGQVRMLDVIQDPFLGRYSDLMILLSNVFRWFMGLLAIGVLWILGRMVLDAIRLPKTEA